MEAAAAHIQCLFGRLDMLVNKVRVGCISDDMKTRMKLWLEFSVTGPSLVTAAFRLSVLKSQNLYSIYASNGAKTLV